jgi:hypothetical protein
MQRSLGAKAGANLLQPAKRDTLVEWSRDGTARIDLTVKHRGWGPAMEWTGFCVLVTGVSRSREAP